MMTFDWYQENVEEPVRGFVKLLRDNGFNTESSCGHEMSIQCQLSVDGEMKRLHDLLYNNGCRDYEIRSILEVVDGHLFPPTIFLKFSKKENGDG